MSHPSTTTDTFTLDRSRRLAPSLDWVRARRREWQAGLGTGCGTERWRASGEAGDTPDDAEAAQPFRGAPPES
jgi:hypothetical protein